MFRKRASTSNRRRYLVYSLVEISKPTRTHGPLLAASDRIYLSNFLVSQLLSIPGKSGSPGAGEYRIRARLQVARTKDASKHRASRLDRPAFSYSIGNSDKEIIDRWRRERSR